MPVIFACAVVEATFGVDVRAACHHVNRLRLIATCDLPRSILCAVTHACLKVRPVSFLPSDADRVACGVDRVIVGRVVDGWCRRQHVIPVARLVVDLEDDAIGASWVGDGSAATGAELIMRRSVRHSAGTQHGDIERRIIIEALELVQPAAVRSVERAGDAVCCRTSTAQGVPAEA